MLPILQGCQHLYLHHRGEHVPLNQICQEAGLVCPGGDSQSDSNSLLSQFHCVLPSATKLPSHDGLTLVERCDVHSLVLPFRIIWSNEPTKSVKTASM